MPSMIQEEGDLDLSEPEIEPVEAGGLVRQETEIPWPTWISARETSATETVAMPTADYNIGLMMAMQSLMLSENGAKIPQVQPLEQAPVAAPVPVVAPISVDLAGHCVPEEWMGVLTVMMRNLPNKYNQSMLVEELNRGGFFGCYDFLYLPIDPDTRANRGYAFINFALPGYAWMFKTAFEGKRMSCYNTDSLKVLSVTPAALQGFDANYAHYSSSRVNRGDPACRPLFLREPTVAVDAARSGRGGRGRRRHGNLMGAATRNQGGMPAEDSRNQPSATKFESVSAPRFCSSCGGTREPHFLFCQFCGCNLTDK